jgi:hypothetical protein
MRTIGIITTGVAAAAAAMGVVLGIRSVPDVKRYLRIRSM